MRYRITKSAQRDLDEIFVYWAKRASLDAADRLIENITDHFWLLGAHPHAGRSCDDFGAGVKCFPAANYLIYYRVNRRKTDILHIFHGARDQQQLLKRPNQGK
jgi:toxin ParE1/3/4